MRRHRGHSKASLAAVDLTLEVVTAAVAGGRVLRVAARPIPYVPRGFAAVAETLAVSGGEYNASASACEGVLKARVCRGRPLSSAAMACLIELAQVGALGEV